MLKRDREKATREKVGPHMQILVFLVWILYESSNTVISSKFNFGFGTGTGSGSLLGIGLFRLSVPVPVLVLFPAWNTYLGMHPECNPD